MNDEATDRVRRILDAQTHLGRVRDLQLMRDIIARQPIFPGVTDILGDVEVELAAAESDVVDALLGNQ